MNKLSRCLITASACAFALLAQAQTTGTPITLVVPYPAGGPLDTSARILATGAAAKLGVIVVENKPGAGGGIGANQVAKSPESAKQLLMGAVATHAANPYLYPNFPYDPLKDFKPLLLVASIPNVLVINTEQAKKLNIRTTADLVAYARKNVGRLNYGSGGNGSIGHIAGEMLKSLTGTRIVHIPYQGAAPAQLGLLSGQVDFMFDNLASALPQIRAGKLTALGVTTLTRSDAAPDVPSINDSISGFNVSTWFGLFAPANASDETVKKQTAAFAEVLAAPDNKEKFSKMGITPPRLEGVEFERFVRAENAKYGALIKAVKIKIE
jgi:tripartite-type tricarboxylate transporter receptor subunit TctC